MAFGAKIRLTVDNSKASAFRKEIQTLVDTSTASHPIKLKHFRVAMTVAQKKQVIRDLQSYLIADSTLSLKINRIDASAAVNGLRKQLQTMLSGLSITGLKEFLGSDSTADIVNNMNSARGVASEWAAQMRVVDDIQKKLGSTYKSALSGNNMINDSSQVTAITAQYNEWIRKVEQLRASKEAMSNEDLVNLQQEGVAIQQKISLLQQERAEEVKNSIQGEKAARSELALAQQQITLRGQIQRYILSNSKAYSLYKDQLEGMLQSLAAEGTITDEKLKEIRRDFIGIQNSARSAGMMGNTFFDTMKKGFAKFGGWSLITRSLMQVYRVFRSMITAVVELDTAMTELRKVTDLSEASYARFLSTATKLSQDVGAKLTDTVNAVADFSRTGYNLEDATSLAEAALVYKNVGDGIDDISKASESLISTIKAFEQFGESADNAMYIVDRFNEIGNNFAISSVGIGEALVRSASALASAGNDLNESIALITAMNAVVQDTDKVGTTLKTVTMYLRAAKTEAEEAGESTDGMANSVSELRKELLTLTKGKVDIMIDDTTFKSTYQIMKELSDVWQSLSDVDAAAILELIGGKRNSNAVVSLLENFDDAENALQTAAGASGSALAENEKYLDSINGKLSILQSKFEAFSNHLISSGVVEFVVSLGSGLLTLLDSLEQIHILLPLIATGIALVAAAKKSKIITETVGLILSTKDAILSEGLATGELAVAVNALTDKQRKLLLVELQRLATSGKITKAEQEQIADMINLAGVTNGVGKANKGLAVSFKTLTASIPVWGWIVLGITAVTEVVSVLSSKIKSSSEHLAELKEQWNEVSTEFDSVNNELQTTNNRMDELLRKDKLTFTEADELENLKKQNRELQRTVDLLREERAEKKREVHEGFVNNMKKRSRDYSQWGSDGELHGSLSNAVTTELLKYTGVAVRTLNNEGVIELQNVNDILDGYLTEKNFYKSKIAEIEAKPYQTLVDSIDIAEYENKIKSVDKEIEKFKSEVEKSQKSAKEWLEDLQSDFRTYAEGIEYISNPTTEADKAVNEYLDKIKDLEDRIAIARGSSSAKTNAFGRIIDNWKFDSLTLELETLGNQGKVTAEMLDDPKYDLFIQKLVEINVIDSVDKLDEIALAFNSLGDAAGKTNDQLNNTDILLLKLDELTSASDTISKIQKAFDDFSDNGYVSLATIAGIKDAVGDSVSNWGKYETKLLSASTTTEDLNRILSELTYYALEAEFGVEGLASATNDRLVAILKERNVLNADAVAQDILTKAKINSAIASYDGIEAISEETKAMIAEGLSADQAELAMRQLNLTRDLFTDSSIDTSDDVTALMAMAIQAGATLESLNRLNNAKQLFLEAEQYNKMASDAKTFALAKLYENRALEATEKAKELIGEGLDYNPFTMNPFGFGVSSKNKDLDNAIKQAERLYEVHQNELEYIEDLEEASRKYAKTEEERLDIQDKIRDARKDYADNRIGDIEHEIEMLKNLEGEEAEVVDKYKEIQRIAQEEADRLRAEGYKDNSNEIQALQKTWWDAQSSIDDGTFGKYLEHAEDLYGKHQDELKYINDLTWGLHNLARTEAQRAEINGLIDQVRMDYADNRISDIEHEIELLEHLGDKDSEIIEKNKEIQRIAHGEADRLRTLGYAESSEEIQNWQKTWWDAQDAINTAKENILTDIEDLVANANEILDGFQDVYAALTDAAKEYNSTGYLSADTLQSILELAPKYLDFLYDENGQLVLNEQALQSVIKAKTEEMAVEHALAYAKQVLNAVQQNDLKLLTELTDVTAESSNATWDMAYATLALAKATGTANGMGADYFESAVSYLDKIRSLSDIAVNSVSSYYKTLDEGYISQKDGLEQILSLTQDLIKWENEQQIEALEKEKELYRDIVERKKEILQLTEEESDHENDVAEKIEKIAKLQSRIDQLSLDDSREATAERKGLEEELSELQKDLADTQADYALNTQIDALDRELEAYEETKDDEIDALQETLNSTEKLYQAAIGRIENDWDNLYQDLLDWNYNYGSTLQSDLTSAWDAASEAVKRYGSFVSAYANADNYTTIGDASTSTSGESDTTSGDAQSIKNAMKNNSLAWFTATGTERVSLENANKKLAAQWKELTGETLTPENGVWYDSNRDPFYLLSDNDVGRAITGVMKQNSLAWKQTSDKTTRDKLRVRNEELADILEDYLGKNVHKDGNGVWWIGNEKLFDVYHNGGVVGGRPTFKQNEVLAVLENGETVLDKSHQEVAYRIIDFAQVLSEKLGSIINASRFSSLINREMMITPIASAPSPTGITNNIEFRPEININIEHSGTFTEDDARRFAGIAADNTLRELGDAFVKRGIGNIGSAILK